MTLATLNGIAARIPAASDFAPTIARQTGPKGSQRSETPQPTHPPYGSHPRRIAFLTDDSSPPSAGKETSLESRLLRPMEHVEEHSHTRSHDWSQF